jgi:hypothetical protein
MSRQNAGTAMNRSRRLLCVVLLAAPMARARAQAAPLPAVNLRAEVRWVDASQVQRDSVGGAGSVTVGTGGSVSADAQVTLRATSREAEGQTLQQVLVLNGGSAQVRLSQAVPLQWVEAVQGPRRSAGVLRQTWVEVTAGVVLRPRWPGGAAPVDLEVVAEAPIGGAETANPGREVIGTRVLVPLGEWFTLARSDTQRAVSERGTLSTRDIERSAQRELQVRISRP